MILHSPAELTQLIHHAQEERSILRPLHLAESDQEWLDIAAVDNHISLLEGEMQWMVDNKCFECGEAFADSDTPFFWLGGTGPLILHMPCFLMWVPAVVQDFEVAKARGELNAL